MITNNWGRILLPIAFSIGAVLAVDPSSAEKAKWDAKCKAKSGATYYMVFNPDGTPSGKCDSPPVWACYFGPYVDPKTGKKGCCGKGNGIWSVDPTFPQEGSCCGAPAIFSFDDKGKKGACCEPPKSWHMDPKTGSGSCCANKDDTYECSCQCKENPIPSCPKWNGKETTLGGKRWKLYCNLINHGENDLGSAPAADWGACIERCAGISNCVRAIYSTGGICYLRTHGNKPVPITPDPYWSAHLVEDPKPDPVKPDPVKPDPTAPIPSKCPDADDKIVTVAGVEYHLYCKNGYSAGRHVIEPYTTAKNIEECAAACSANPKCQGVNFYDDGQPDGCVMTDEHESPPLGGPPGGDFVCAVPTKKRV